MTRAGFVSLIGAPNAGKSTLMNTLIGSKVSIVTPKVQTTRSRIRGIVMHDDAQVIFIDTPGIFKPKKRLDRAMVNAAWQGASDSDITVLVHDAARTQVDADTKRIVEHLGTNAIACVLVLNKIDLIPRARLLKRASELTASAEFTRVFMVSAEKANGTDSFIDWLASMMPQGPYYFDAEDLSDMPQRLLAAETLREKLFLNMHQELPYQLAVETESWKEKNDGSVEIRCTIFIAREGHRGIILGKGGKTLGRIGMSARLELEQALDRRVHLFTHIKVRDWMNDPQHYRHWDLDFNA